MSRKLKDVALSNQVYEELRKDLISGRYQPGEKITISSLAEAFGVSPTPVREAIRLLIAEGGLDLKPNHSVTVAAMSWERYREVTRIRLEPYLEQIVTAGRDTIERVFVAGRCVLRDGRPTQAGEAEIVAKAQKSARAIAARIGLGKEA